MGIRCVAIFASVFLSLANAHHVLFVHSFGTKSHLILMKPLIEELLAKDHQVTSIFFNSIKINHAMMFFGKHFMDWQSNALLAYQKEYLKDEVGLEVSPTIGTVLREHISLVLSCSHPITHGAWQYLPNVVQVGG